MGIVTGLSTDIRRTLDAQAGGDAATTQLTPINHSTTTSACQFDPGLTPSLERETGIEPASLAWKAKVLPLNYSRLARPAPTENRGCRLHGFGIRLVEEAGFEPA